MSADLHVVVVHHERPLDCVRTVRAFRGQGVALSVTVVDNGSSAAARERLRADLPSGGPPVEIIEAGANLGFGAAANLGLRRWLEAGQGDWVAVAPHDALPAPGCLAALLAAVSERPGAGLASAEFGDDTVPVVDPYFGGLVMARTRGTGWTPADYPHGTLLLARRACLEQVGLFDERFFAYCEEADLGLRARAAGWEVGQVWGAVVGNPGMGDHVVAEYLQLRNTLSLVRRHSGRYHAAIRLALAGIDVTRRVVTRRGGAGHRARAMVDYVAGRTGPPPPGLGPSRSGAPHSPATRPPR